MKMIREIVSNMDASEIPITHSIPGTPEHVEMDFIPSSEKVEKSLDVIVWFGNVEYFSSRFSKAFFETIDAAFLVLSRMFSILSEEYRSVDATNFTVLSMAFFSFSDVCIEIVVETVVRISLLVVKTLVFFPSISSLFISLFPLDEFLPSSLDPSR